MLAVVGYAARHFDPQHGHYLDQVIPRGGRDGQRADRPCVDCAELAVVTFREPREQAAIRQAALNGRGPEFME